MKCLAIISGQFLSLIYTLSGVFTELLVEDGLDTPIFQVAWQYVFIFAVYITIILVKKQHLEWGQAWKFLLASLTDSQGNFLVLLGFQYTSVTSVFTLGNTSIIMVMCLSIVFLETKFAVWEYGGAALALVGAACIVISDLWSSGWVWGGSFFGDMMVLVGTLLYSM